MNDSPDSLQKDNRSGASELTGTVYSLYEDYIKGYTDKDILGLERSLKELGASVIAAQPMMAPVRRVVNLFSGQIGSMYGALSDAAEMQGFLLKYQQELKLNSSSMLRKTGSINSEIISPESVVTTYSRSGTLMSLFSAAAEKGIDFSVVLSEARPANEGIGFAKEIADLGIHVTLTVDILLPEFIAESDCLILGSDWISEEWFVNKIGSGLLVKTARELNVPIYIIAASDKYYPAKFFPKDPDERPAEEILTEAHEGISVVNRYFEKIPLTNDLIFVNEDGIATDIIHLVNSDIPAEAV